MATYTGGRLSPTGEGLRASPAPITGAGISRITDKPLRANLFFGGNDYVAGVVEINGAPRLAKVKLHEQITGLLVAAAWTNSVGAFRFDQLSPTLKFYIVAFDPVTGEQAVVFDRI